MRRLLPEWHGYPLVRIIDPGERRPYLQRQFQSLFSLLAKHVLIQTCRHQALGQREQSEPGITLPAKTDIWIRDFHPFGIHDSETDRTDYLAFRYEPKYLGQKKLLNSAAINSQLVGSPEYSDLIIDGGNIVHDGLGNIIMTERVLSDNNLSAAQLKTALSKYFEVRKLFFIPEEPGDISGHVDGSVQILNPETAAINHYHREFETQREYRLKVARTIGRHFSAVSIPCEQPLEISGEGFLSAWGNRLNWLRWHEKILFPAFGNQRDAETSEMLNRFHIAPVPIPIEAFELVTHFGGSLHCVTAPYWPVLGNE